MSENPTHCRQPVILEHGEDAKVRLVCPDCKAETPYVYLSDNVWTREDLRTTALNDLSLRLALPGWEYPAINVPVNDEDRSWLAHYLAQELGIFCNDPMRWVLRITKAGIEVALWVSGKEAAVAIAQGSLSEVDLWVWRDRAVNGLREWHDEFVTGFQA